MRPTTDEEFMEQANESFKKMDSKNSTAPANLVDGLKHAYLHFIDNYSARNFEELETLSSEKLMDKIRNEREEDLMLPFQRIN